MLESAKMEQKKPFVAPDFEIVDLTVGDILMSSVIKKPDEWIPDWF